jgi:adenylate cyclase
MSQIILHQKGTIDKFIGDAIMAFWNAPLNQIQHAKFACTSALLQQKAL